jgi:hypothetical protein
MTFNRVLRNRMAQKETSWGCVDEGVILKYRECIFETSYSDRSVQSLGIKSLEME